MIVSNLKHCEKIEALDPMFAKLFEYVKNNDLLNAPLGSVNLDGDNLIVHNVEPECVAEQLLETHENYLDVHILLSGSETIGWRALEEISTVNKPYNSETDCAFWSEKPTTYVNLLPGEFMVVYPEDAHAPLIGEGKIRKIVAKIKCK